MNINRRIVSRNNFIDLLHGVVAKIEEAITVERKLEIII